MKTNYLSLILFLALNLTITSSPAELFKWVDKNGKVHYSDKQPTDKSKTKLVPLTKSVTQVVVEQSASKAILKPYDQTARKVFLLDTRYSWKKQSESSKNKKIGAYYAGKGCSSRGAMKVPDVYINHKDFFPRESELSRRMMKVINSLDYESDRSSKYDLLRKLKHSGGLSLHSEIISLSFNTCAPHISKRDRLKPVNNISAYQFKKHRIKLKVHWQLKSNRDQDVIYEKTTDGSFSGWQSENPPSIALANAVESATLKLYSDKKFIHKVMVEEDNGGIVTHKSTNAQPIKFSGKTEPHRLFLTVDENVWTRRLGNEDTVGMFLFGEKCSANKPMKLLDAVNNQKWFFANNAESTGSVVKAISSAGYSIQRNTENALSEIENSDGYTLFAEVVGINYNICAPSLSATAKYKTLNDIKKNKLSRKQLKITVKWSLKTDRNRVLLYQTRTEGIAGSLLVDSKGSAVMQKAITNASRQLLSDAHFIKKISKKTRKTEAMNSFPLNKLKPGSAIARPEKGEVKQILLVTNNTTWNDLPAAKHRGYYAVGENCSTIKSKSWPEALNEYPAFYPTAAELAGSASKILKSLDYRHKRSDQYNLLKNKRKTGAYSLHSEIMALRFDSCAPAIKSDFEFGGKRKISTNSFKRHRVSIKIKWQLIGNSNQQILYEKLSQGISDSWLLNAKPKIIMGQAIENATSVLFADPRFIDEIMLQEKVEESFFSKLFSSSTDNKEDTKSTANPYILKAHLGQTFVEITPIKMMVTEYYHSYGKWPESLSEMGLSDYSGSKTVSDISIEYDGSILIELTDMFGEDKSLKLSPTLPSSENAYNLRWICSSNLVKNYLPSNCETM